MVFNGFGPRNELFERTAAAAAAAQDWVARHTVPAGLRTDGLGARIHAAAAEAGYDEEERARLVRAFLSAGIDTTVNAIGSALWCLARHPAAWNSLREDPTGARAVFEETVRFESPVQTFFRTTTEDTEVDGVPVPADSKVLLFLGAANRDPRRFDHPDEFDPGRSTGGHVGFGHGAHACAGRVLARMEGETLLTEMARRFGILELDGLPEREINNTTRGFARLPLRVTGS
jgi:cytochrome P450